jgi:hypothetical protein
MYDIDDEGRIIQAPGKVEYVYFGKPWIFQPMSRDEWRRQEKARKARKAKKYPKRAI